MNLATTLDLYCTVRAMPIGTPAPSTLPEDGTNHPETNFTRKQQQKGPDKGGTIKGDAAGSSLPDLYNVIDPVGRLLHKDLSYDDAKKASEARRYAKVVPARSGLTQDVWNKIKNEKAVDKGKRTISNVERRSMPTPDVDWAVVR